MRVRAGVVSTLSMSTQRTSATPPPRLKEGFDVPRQMGLGLAALGRPGYINLGHGADVGASNQATEDGMRERAEEMLDAAWARGVRWFDAARSYGLAERFLGDWLRKRGILPSEVCVSSKWGYRYTAEWRVDTKGEPHEVKDHSLSHLLSQTNETLETLGEYLNVYQIHSATFESGVLDNEAVLRELSRLKRTKGWKIGLSVSSPAQPDVLRAALEKTVSYDDDDDDDDDGSKKNRDQKPPLLFDACQVTYNLLEQSPGPALVEARERGVAVVVKEAMANGRVLRAPALLEAADELNCAPDALALAAVLAQPFQPYVLSGAVTTQQLDSNLEAAAAVLDKLRARPERLQALLDACRQDPQAYWADRAALQWN